MISASLRRLSLVSFLLFSIVNSLWCSKPLIHTENPSPQVEFAQSIMLQKIRIDSFPYHILMRLNNNLEEQAFTIQTIEGEILIEGGDAIGLMYGGLELAEYFELSFNLSQLSVSKSPTQKNRGLKFNIPLDARCPSYDDTGDAAQKNIQHMWDFSFWTAFLDKMALYRYNVLSLWSPNPFQVMTKLPDYPDLALDDVCLTTLKPGGKVGEWDDAGGVNEAVLENLRTVKEISIDDKISFWQKVFDYADSRGVDVYFYFWNIYTNGTYGKYGLTESIDNPKTKAYYRQAINVFLQTYPQLKGIGVTAGERMHVPKERDMADERERWLWESYGQGILDYKIINPEREIHFVHRVWYSKFDQIMKYWSEYPDPFDVGFKYVKARIYSSPQESPFIGGLKEGLSEAQLKCWWNLRNDDIFVYRWGDPDYVREFISNLPGELTAGYHMGADGYVFGLVFSDKEPSIQGTLELDKHWYKFMLWGRLGYDNKLANDYIRQLLGTHYKLEDPNLLFDTWQMASKIVPQINRYMFHNGDRHWAPEMCSSRESFKYAPCFRVANPMPKNGIVNPKIHWKRKVANTLNPNTITPQNIVDSLHTWSNFVLDNKAMLEGSTKELSLINVDLEAFAWLGKYYAQKIEAAETMEEIASQGMNEKSKSKLTESMEKASEYWTYYADLSDKYYNTQMYARVNTLDWIALKEDVEFDEKLVANIYSKYSLEEQNKLKSKELSVLTPHKNTRKWVKVSTPESGMAELYLYDERGELINMYRHPCEEGESLLVWEDLAWMAKGEYTLIFRLKNRTTQCVFSQ